MKIPLVDICDFKGGTQPPKDEWIDHEEPGYIRMLQIRDFTQSEKNNIEYVKDTSNLKKCTPDDILIGRYGASVGKILTGLSGAYNVAIVKTVPNKEKVCPQFLFHYFNAPYFQNHISSVGSRAAQAGFNKDDLGKLYFPLLPLDEQRRIAAVLDKVSGLIAKRREQLDKLDELVKARFVEMFGDPVSNPHQYPINQLSEYIEFLTSGSRGWSQYFSDDGEYFITIKNVKNCSISLEDVQYIKPPDNADAVRTKVKDGDLLISITADLGRTGVVTKEIADHGAYINQHLTCIRLNREKLNPLYVAYYMESPAGKMQFNAKNQAGVKAGLNFNAINSLKLVVPPLEKQGLFVEFVSQTDKSKLTIRQSLDKLEVLKKALMQQYFG